MKKSIYILTMLLVLTVFFSKSVSAQIGTMMPNIWMHYSPACGFNFYDDGGLANPFMAGAKDTITLTGNGTDKIQLTFNSFDVGAGIMNIYDGMDALSAPIGTYTGTTGPSIIQATNANGALTIVFVASTSMPGWDASISCVGGGETVNFMINPSYPCAPYDISNLVTNNSTYPEAGYNYVWSIIHIDSGIRDTSKLYGYFPVNYIVHAGHYDIQLTVYSITDSSYTTPMDQQFNSTDINNDISKLKLVPAGGDTSICPNSTISFQIQGSSYNYVEYFYHGNYQQSNTIQFGSQPIDSVNAHVVMNGCDAYLVCYLSISVTAVPHPKIAHDFGNKYCPGDKIDFKTEGRYTGYYWDFNGEGSSTLPSPTYQFDSIGEKHVVLTVSSICGTYNNAYDTIMIATGIQPSAMFNFNNNYSDGRVCRNIPVQFSATSPGTYTWDFGDGTTDIVPFPVKVYNTAVSHTVSLTVHNGCSLNDTYSQPVVSNQNQNSTLGNVYFTIGTDQENYDPGNNQTLIVCPGESIYLINKTGTQSQDESFSFRWNFGNGANDTSSEINPVHAYPAGNKNYMITLSAVNNCGATGTAYQYITIDNKTMPYTSLQVIPAKICPGEKVYFYDEHYHEKYDRLKYSINFGDGDSITNQVNLDNKDLYTLAEHPYPLTNNKTYNFTFTARNACNSVTRKGTILVTTNPHAQMYYISNNTLSNNNEYPGDFGVRHLPGDAEIDVPVRWPSMGSIQDSAFYLFFFRGGFDINSDNRPAGLVKFKATSAMNTVQVVKAFIPYDVGYDTIGIGFGHYCFSQSISGGDKPNLYALPTTRAGQPIYKFAVNRNLVATTINDTITLPADVSNVCSTSKPFFGEWQFNSGSITFYLEIQQDQDSTEAHSEPYPYVGHYNLTTKQGLKENEISEGYVYSQSSFIYFYDNNCSGLGMYMYNYVSQNKQLTFMNYGDPCTKRNGILYGPQYTPRDIFDNTIASCTKSPIKFVVAGADSVSWYFSDTSYTVKKTNIAYHSYANAGTYDAYAVVKNGCSNKDTIHTKVVVSDNTVPFAEIDFNEGNSLIMAGVPVEFKANTPSDDTLKFTCSWDFGDGINSSLFAPVHIFSKPGNYYVSLVVSNGCGNDSAHVIVQVSKTYTSTCAAEFAYLVNGNTVEFYNLTDKPGNVFTWNFGDSIGTATIKNPQYTYQNEGSYLVILNVTGTNACSSAHWVYISPNRMCNAAFYCSIQGLSVNLSTSEPMPGIYAWNFGDGTKGSGTYTSHTYSKPGWYRISLQTVSPGCTDSSSQWIQVQNTCIQPNITMNISGDTVYLKNYTNNKDNLVWFWDYGDGTTSKAVNPSDHAFKHSGVYYMYMTMFDPLYGCKIKMDTTVLIGSIDCYAYFTADSTSNDTTVIFHNHSSTATNYIWNFGDGTISRLQNPPVKHYLKSGVYNVCLTVADVTKSCTQTYCKDISVGQVRCDADFAYIVDTTSGKVSFSNMSSDANNYFWDFGDGNFGFSKDTFHFYNKPGIYNVDLSIWNETSQCYNEVNKNILVAGQSAKLTTANFDFFVKEGNDSVLFINNSTNATKYYWTFGDGSFLAIKDPVKVYQRAGIYEVCLTIFDVKSGNSDRQCKIVPVGTGMCNIVAGIGYIIDSTNSTVHFADKSTGDYDSYYWTFGDGTTSADSAPVKTYTTPGFYLVTLAVKKSNSMCVDFASQFIEVGQNNCKANFDYVVNDSTNLTTFTNQSAGTISNYYWYFDDGSYTLDKDPTHKFTQGMHDVSLTVAGGTCMDYTDKKIQVGNVGCSAHFTYYVDIPSLTTWCKNEALGPATQYYWSFGDGSFSADTSPVHQFNYPGYYTIGLNTFNATTGCMDYYQTPVLIGSEGIDCQADFIYKVDTSKRQAAFSSKSIGNITKYTWDFGDGSATAAGKDTLHTYPHKGFYDVCLSIVNDKNVPNMKCKWIEVAPDSKTNCHADFNLSIDAPNKTVSLVNKSLGTPVKFDWSLGDSMYSTQKDSLIHIYTKGGYYLISLHITTATGCESYGYKLINIDQPDGIYAKFGYLAKDYNAKAGGYPVDFGGAGLGDNSRLRWNFGDGSENSTSMTPTHVYAEEGTYYVCLTYSDTVTHEESTVCDSVSTQTKCQNDSIDPVAKCKNISIDIPLGGSLDISPLDINNSSTDDCGIYDYYLDNKTFTSANEGPNQIHLTVTDYNSHSSTCSAVVTVVVTGIASTSLNPSDFEVSPNPVSNFMTISCQLQDKCEIEFVIYDMLGNRIITINSMKAVAGKLEQTYDASSLKSGSYILQLKTSMGIIERKVIIKK